MSDIYDQHKAAFAHVSAYVVLNSEGERVATVALKFPRDGAGHLWAYVHVFGFSMERGYAGGFGYDKSSTAVHAACRKLLGENVRGRQGPCADVNAKCNADLQGVAGAVTGSSLDWTYEIERAGYRVLQAV